jgi:hypothetical protein
MPGWRHCVRIMIDWFFALLFQPDIVKISLDSKDIERRRKATVVGGLAGRDSSTWPAPRSWESAPWRKQSVFPPAFRCAGAQGTVGVV